MADLSAGAWPRVLHDHEAPLYDLAPYELPAPKSTPTLRRFNRKPQQSPHVIVGLDAVLDLESIVVHSNIWALSKVNIAGELQRETASRKPFWGVDDVPTCIRPCSHWGKSPLHRQRVPVDHM
eukprot:scaffold1311_cov256-Pinguiococcus_pyrenoidosus.AAC.53